MENTYNLIDNFFNGYNVIFLDIISVISLMLGIAVIVNKNPIKALMYLILLFGTISVYFMFVGLNFIALSYLIVYIGAVSILFLFILMLINIRTSELQSDSFNSIPLALFFAIVLNHILFEVLPYQTAVINTYNSTWNNIVSFLTLNFNNLFLFGKNIISDVYIMFVTSNCWDGNMTESSHISTIGNILYTSYNMWLFLSSLILLLAMVGAITITIKTENERN